MRHLMKSSDPSLESVVMTHSDHDNPSPTSLIALDLTPDLSSRQIHHLLERMDVPHAIAADILLGSTVSSLSSRLSISPSESERLARSFAKGARMVEREERGRKDAGIDLIPYGSCRYPDSLAMIPDPPLLLRCLGDPASAAVGLAIVGSRKPSDYGARLTPQFVRSCSEAGVSVVSGGARGVDGIAHGAAILDGVPTLAVLGNGLRIPYPSEHEDLFQAVLGGGGCLLSETSVFAPPRPWLFPRRNRIISGLSLGVLVVEAAARSGAIITARLAVEEHGRDVLAVPGRIGDSMSAGCLRMISEGWAGVACSPDQAVGELLRGARVLISGGR